MFFMSMYIWVCVSKWVGVSMMYTGGYVGSTSAFVDESGGEGTDVSVLCMYQSK